MRGGIHTYSSGSCSSSPSQRNNVEGRIGGKDVWKEKERGKEGNVGEEGGNE